MPATRDNTVAGSGIHETVSKQPYEIAEAIPPVPCRDNMQGDDLPESMAHPICDVALSSLRFHPHHMCSSRSPNEC